MRRSSRRAIMSDSLCRYLTATRCCPLLMSTMMLRAGNVRAESIAGQHLDTAIHSRAVVRCYEMSAPQCQTKVGKVCNLLW